MMKMLRRPMPWVGCYCLHLYCKYETGEYEHDRKIPTADYSEYQTFARAKKAAVADGWVFHADGTTTCRACKKSGAE